MAIFGKERTQQGTRNGSTIVAAGTQFVGNLTLTDSLHVDGQIDGDVQSESNVVIGVDGYLKGTIKAATVVVSGRVDGSISSDRLEIIAGGCVEGDVHIANLVIEPGGRFNGSSESLTAEAPEAKPRGTGKPGPAAGRKSPKAADSNSAADEVGSPSTA